MALRLMSLAPLKSLVLSGLHSSLPSSLFESLQTSQPGIDHVLQPPRQLYHPSLS